MLKMCATVNVIFVDWFKLYNYTHHTIAEDPTKTCSAIVLRAGNVKWGSKGGLIQSRRGAGGENKEGGWLPRLQSETVSFEHMLGQNLEHRDSETEI